MPALRLIKPWWPALVWMAVIFVFSSDLGSADRTSRFLGPLLRWFKPDLTGEELAAAQFLIRKLGHVAEYAVLAVLLRRGFGASLGPVRSPRVLACAWLAAVAYAVTDEWHQSFVSTRTASAGDVAIDAAGAALGLVLARWAVRRKS